MLDFLRFPLKLLIMHLTLDLIYYGHPLDKFFLGKDVFCQVIITCFCREFLWMSWNENHWILPNMPRYPKDRNLMDVNDIFGGAWLKI